MDDSDSNSNSNSNSNSSSLSSSGPGEDEILEDLVDLSLYDRAGTCGILVEKGPEGKECSGCSSVSFSARSWEEKKGIGFTFGNNTSIHAGAQRDHTLRDERLWRRSQVECEIRTVFLALNHFQRCFAAQFSQGIFADENTSD